MRTGWNRGAGAEGVLLALVAGLGWGCASSPHPGMGEAIAPGAEAEAPLARPEGPDVHSPDEAALAEAEAEGVDESRIVEARLEAEQAVEQLDEVSRREFYRLFGSDPLGLGTRPANAARYDIPVETNAQVERWIEYFTTKGRDRFATYLSRAGRYEAMIRGRLRAAGLPEDLVYLAMIESGMNPRAYSRAHAVGLWQFIRGTGRLYGLEISYWIDERRDPYKATDAAIRHLSDLYAEFGSWYLAAAAYNAGRGRVNRGIKRTGSRDFWDLADARVLRRETRNYVPKLIAAAIIGKNAAEYGFGDIELLTPLEFDLVEVPDATSFDVLAAAAGTDEGEIRLLNPHYPRLVTPPGQAAEVRIPAGRAGRFAAAYAQVPADERVTWLEHVVTRGQTLSHIAQRYGTSVQAIRAANSYVNPRRLQIGQRLIIPRAGGKSTRLAAASRVPPPADGVVTITVRRGDTLWAIGRRYNVSTSRLMEMNGLSSSVIHPGDRITVRR